MIQPSPSNPFGESPEALRHRKARSLAIAVGLLAFVALVFVVTILKLSSGHGV